MEKKIVVTSWQNRVAPLFDVAREFKIFLAKEDTLIFYKTVVIEEKIFFLRLLKIKKIRPDVIICGAISKPFFVALIGLDVEVIPFIVGEIDKVIMAYLKGCLVSKAFVMPGCYKQRKHIFRRWMMAGQGGNRGRLGRVGTQGGGRGGGGMRGKVDGFCVCPKCGYKEEHLRGQPCFEKICPDCQIKLVRGD